jgi:hypothetical protein
MEQRPTAAPPARRHARQRAPIAACASGSHQTLSGSSGKQLRARSKPGGGKPQY